MVQHTPCRTPKTARLINVHLVILRGALYIPILLLVFRVVLSVAPSLSFAAAGRKEVVDGSCEQVAALRRDVLEDGFWRRLAFVDMCYFIGTGREVQYYATIEV